jgi:hypothetical protein
MAIVDPSVNHVGCKREAAKQRLAETMMSFHSVTAIKIERPPAFDAQ